MAMLSLRHWWLFALWGMVLFSAHGMFFLQCLRHPEDRKAQTWGRVWVEFFAETGSFAAGSCLMLWIANRWFPLVQPY